MSKRKTLDQKAAEKPYKTCELCRQEIKDRYRRFQFRTWWQVISGGGASACSASVVCCKRCEEMYRLMIERILGRTNWVPSEFTYDQIVGKR